MRRTSWATEPGTAGVSQTGRFGRLTLRAGDIVAVVDGLAAPWTGEVVAVRWLAADPGYRLRGVDGLVRPEHVTLTQARGGNPCGADCDAREHETLAYCQHCQGTCWHR